MEPDNSEYFKIKQWVDTFLKIPFGKFQTLDVVKGLEREY